MLVATVFEKSASDGRWHWLVVEVASSALSLWLDNVLLIQRLYIVNDISTVASLHCGLVALTEVETRAQLSLG